MADSKNAGQILEAVVENGREELDLADVQDRSPREIRARSRGRPCPGQC